MAFTSNYYDTSLFNYGVKGVFLIGYSRISRNIWDGVIFKDCYLNLI